MMNEHTAKAFDVDLQELARMVAEMGGIAEKQIADSIDALAKRDGERAKRVVAADATIDALQQLREDDDPSVQAEACIALQTLQSKGSLPSGIAFLSSQK